MKLPYIKVKFYPEVKSQTDLSSLRVSCKRALRQIKSSKIKVIQGPKNDLYRTERKGTTYSAFYNTLINLEVIRKLFMTIFPARKYVSNCRSLSKNSRITLTYFMPLVSFYTPEKHQKTRGILIFSGGIERDQWYEKS